MIEPRELGNNNKRPKVIDLVQSKSARAVTQRYLVFRFQLRFCGAISQDSTNKFPDSEQDSTLRQVILSLSIHPLPFFACAVLQIDIDLEPKAINFAAAADRFGQS